MSLATREPDASTASSSFVSTHPDEAFRNPSVSVVLLCVDSSDRDAAAGSSRRRGSSGYCRSRVPHRQLLFDAGGRLGGLAPSFGGQETGDQAQAGQGLREDVVNPHAPVVDGLQERLLRRVVVEVVVERVRVGLEEGCQGLWVRREKQDRCGETARQRRGLVGNIERIAGCTPTPVTVVRKTGPVDGRRHRHRHRAHCAAHSNRADSPGCHRSVRPIATRHPPLVRPREVCCLPESGGAA